MLELPFKPFTADEVIKITGVSFSVLDHWMKNFFTLHRGCGATGLEYMQTFAVFVGWRWHEEGAGADRVGKVIQYVCTLTPETMAKEFERGATFPVLGLTHPILVKAPSGSIGQRLNLEVLFREFKHRLAVEFPPTMSFGVN